MATADKDGAQSQPADGPSETAPGAALPAYPTAAESFVGLMTSEIKRDDVRKMVDAQEHMLMRFEKTNEMLLNFNSLSTSRFEATCRDFKHHTQLLIDMKKELDSIFKRIRVVKTKLGQQHPEAFKVCSDVYNMLEVEEMAENGNPAVHITAAASHPAAAGSSSGVPPGATVTNLGVVETPAAQHMAKPSQSTSTPSKDVRDKEKVDLADDKGTAQIMSGARKKVPNPELRKSWPAAKPPSARKVQPGVAVVIAGEDDDSDT